MKKRLAIIPALLLTLPLFVWFESEAQPAAVVFRHATVIDMTGAPPQSDVTVVVVGNRIAAVDRSGKARVPRGARVVDATGKYLIPGLWDMHVHSPGDAHAREIFLPLTLANGVTGERHMFGGEVELKQRADVRGGALLGPRMVVGSPVVDGPVPMWRGSVSVADADAGRRAVRALKQKGYDFIKVYQFLPREAYYAIADEARKQNIPYAGHVPFSVSAREASDAGQRSFEHSFGITLACSAQEESLRPTLAKAAAEVKEEFAPHLDLFIRNETLPLDSYSEQKGAALFKRLAANGTYVVPTLVLHRSLASAQDAAFKSDPRVKYMPPGVRRVFEWELAFFKDYRPVYERMMRTAGAMHRAGVKILAGTDTMNAYIFPGFSLHDELGLLVEAGLSPLEALQTATVNPAKYLGLSNDLGTVEKGKLADLLLLEANPLENIGNTKRIAAVVADGRLLTKETLEKMLADAEAAANRK